jgi:hypothetical protein
MPSAMGFVHLRSLKREKSSSVEQRITPYSIANAARCACGTRLADRVWFPMIDSKTYLANTHIRDVSPELVDMWSSVDRAALSVVGVLF